MKFASLTVNNGSVVVYYSRMGSTMRFPTGITIGKDKTKTGNKFQDWDYRTSSVKGYVEGSALMNQEIRKILNRANSILESEFAKGKELSGNELKIKMNQAKTDTELKFSAKFLDMYEQFYEMKRKKYLAYDKIISLKDYTSFRNLIIDYQIDKEMELLLDNINEPLLIDLHYWLMADRPKTKQTTNGVYTFKTRGGMKQSTIKKRFDILGEFHKYLIKNEMADYSAIVSDYKKSEIRKPKVYKVSLQVDEIYALLDYKFENEQHNKIKLLFVFACLTGMRWKDLSNFSPAHIIYRGKVPFYRFVPSKTRNTSSVMVEIPLHDTAMEILKKTNNLCSVRLSQVNANIYIKEALRLTGMFNDITLIEDKKTRQYLKRWECIHMHSARATFITNLVKITPLNEIMKYTGHSKLSTLQEYLADIRETDPTYIKETFNRPPTI